LSTEIIWGLGLHFDDHKQLTTLTDAESYSSWVSAKLICIAQKTYS